MKQKVQLVSISFPERDLSLAPVSLKNYAMKFPEISRKYEIKISQFLLDDSAENMFEKLHQTKSDYYGFSTYVWNIEKVLKVAELLKRNAPCTKIMLGGPEASGMAEKLLSDYSFVDFIFLGEGEVSFSKFLMTEKYHEVSNLMFRRNQKVVKTDPQDYDNLDNYPLPYESEDYRAFFDNSPTTVRAAIETSRGCPFSCGYCSWGKKKVRYFSLEKVKPAIRYLLEHPKVRTVYITDSNPFLKKERAKELLNYIIKHNVHKKSITFELNPEYMTDEEVLSLITKLNNEEFAFGVQSTSPKVLKLIGRKFDGKRYRDNIRFMKEKNKKVQMWFSLIIGLPGDNLESFLDSTNFVLNLEPTGIYFHELLCLPGSSFYNDPKKYGLEFMENAPHKLLYNETFSEKELNMAKYIGFHIYMFHQIPNFTKELQMISDINKDKRMIDIYVDFINSIKNTIDFVSEEKVKNIPSWFFERETSKLFKETDLVMTLQLMLKKYKRRYKNGYALQDELLFS